MYLDWKQNKLETGELLATNVSTTEESMANGITRTQASMSMTAIARKKK